MKIRFESKFAKDLRSIDEKTILTRISEVIAESKQADNLMQIMKLKKFKGYENC